LEVSEGVSVTHFIVEVEQTLDGVISFDCLIYLHVAVVQDFILGFINEVIEFISLNVVVFLEISIEIVELWVLEGDC
jgi:hypothetical protein